MQTHRVAGVLDYFNRVLESNACPTKYAANLRE